jgi:hypothetical protein
MKQNGDTCAGALSQKVETNGILDLLLQVVCRPGFYNSMARCCTFFRNMIAPDILKDSIAQLWTMAQSCVGVVGRFCRMI